mmetsp:Transcript_5713/g.14678  ORF Transcript_5713/g.14678 Transcript_5713/m.14678 type:complete len:366 (+) Transcript_5713:92-1189(+)
MRPVPAAPSAIRDPRSLFPVFCSTPLLPPVRPAAHHRPRDDYAASNGSVSYCFCCRGASNRRSTERSRVSTGTTGKWRRAVVTPTSPVTTRPPRSCSASSSGLVLGVESAGGSGGRAVARAPSSGPCGADGTTEASGAEQPDEAAAPPGSSGTKRTAATQRNDRLGFSTTGTSASRRKRAAPIISPPPTTTTATKTTSVPTSPRPPPSAREGGASGADSEAATAAAATATTGAMQSSKNPGGSGSAAGGSSAERACDPGPSSSGQAGGAATGGPSTLPAHQRAAGDKEIHRGQGIPLTDVVTDGVQRWFQETYREAQRGDVKMQALLGEMLQEGYGCDADPEAGREWAAKAKKRGYRMRRVYCEL